MTARPTGARPYEALLRQCHAGGVTQQDKCPIVSRCAGLSGQLVSPLTRGAFATMEALRRLTWWRPVFSRQPLAVKRQGRNNVRWRPQLPQLHDNTEIHPRRSRTFMDPSARRL